MVIDDHEVKGGMRESLIYQYNTSLEKGGQGGDKMIK